MHRSLTAGIFYPEDPAALRRQLQENFLEYEERIPLPAALFIPHAAYEYVLPFTAGAFAPFTRENPSRVILLAPIHGDILKEDAPKTLFLPSSTSITTPLGDMAIDQDLCEQLDGVHPSIGFGDHYFDEETAVELAVPPLQFLFEGAQLIPILAGETTAATAAALAAIITPLVDEETLVIISTNLTGWDRKELLEDEASLLLDTLRTASRDSRPPLMELYRKKRITACGTVLFDALHRTGLCTGPWQVPDREQPVIGDLIDDRRSTRYGSGYMPLESRI